MGLLVLRTALCGPPDTPGMAVVTHSRGHLIGHQTVLPWPEKVCAQGGRWCSDAAEAGAWVLVRALP